MHNKCAQAQPQVNRDLCRIRAHQTSGRVRVRVRPPPRIRVRVRPPPAVRVRVRVRA